MAVCYNARLDNTIAHITHNNIQHPGQPSVRKIKKKKFQKTYYTLSRLRNEYNLK